MWKYISSKMLVLAVSVAVLLYQVSAQAPGDHDQTCRTGPTTRQDHIFPAEWRILVDTYDYQNLFDPFNFPAPPWTARDFDGDSFAWETNIGGTCEWNMRVVCEIDGSTDNWLFSQHISYENANEVLFNVSYRFQECVVDSECTRPYVTLYRYDRDTVASTTAERINRNNYQLLNNTEMTSRLEQGTGSDTVSETRSFLPSPDSSGFYLALRDEGTCGSVVRIIMYYVVCPARTVGLVSYPETAVPVRGSSDMIFDAMCASNAHNTTTLQVTAFSSSSTCSDVAQGGAVCVCDAGYVLSDDRTSCEACSAGSYRTLNDVSCQICPANTETNVMAAAECNCIDGFFRNDDPLEGPQFDCTEPPSECTNLQVVATTDTTVRISWTRPATTGRSDYFYQVLHSNPNDTLGDLLVENDRLVDTSSTVTYTLSGLVPFTQYLVRITTHNGVSDQDPDNSHLRQCEVSSMTQEGIPGPPNMVQYLCTVIVWQEPLQPNGNILNYEIEFSGFMSQRESLDAGVNFFITPSNRRTSDTQARLRAINGAGEGQWTSFTNLGCSSTTPDCPDPSPSTCPPSPTCLPPTQELQFQLKGTTYLNNTVVLIDDIGEGADGLLCITNNTNCCGTNRQGEFYYPNGSQVPISDQGQDFYRNRADDGIVRLNRRQDAQSPTGQYSCEVPDASGANQAIYITIVSTFCSIYPPPISCPTCPSVETSSTISPASTCPPCPTTPPPPPPSMCTPCPVLTTMPSECPSCPSTTVTYPTPSGVSTQILQFQLNGTTYLNNTVVLIDDIGEGVDGLLCITNNTDCCRTNRWGEFYYPDGSQVPISDEGQDFYRNRADDGIVRLNRRQDAQSPTGKYSCEVPNASGANQTIYINIVSTGTDQTPCSETCPPVPSACTPCEGCSNVTTVVIADCPPTPTSAHTPDIPTSAPTGSQCLIDHIEAEGSFVFGVNSPFTEKTVSISFMSEVSMPLLVTVPVIPGERLFKIPKDKLTNLEKGQSFSLQVKECLEQSYDFQFAEEVVAPNEGCCPNKNIFYIIITAVASVIVTAAIAGFIIVMVICCLLKKYKSSDVNFLAKNKRTESFQMSTKYMS